MTTRLYPITTPRFEPRAEMEICQGVNGDSHSDEKQHYMDERQKSLISTIQFLQWLQ